MRGELTEAISDIIDMETGMWEYDGVSYNVEPKRYIDGEIIEDEDGPVIDHLDVIVRFKPKSQKGGG